MSSDNKVRKDSPIFVKCSAKEHTFPNGGSVLNFSMKASDMHALADTHANSRGYVNLKIGSRRDVGQYGDTHSATVDKWEPSGAAVGPKAVPPAKPISVDDIPF